MNDESAIVTFEVRAARQRLNDVWTPSSLSVRIRRIYHAHYFRKRRPTSLEISALASARKGVWHIDGLGLKAHEWATFSSPRHLEPALARNSPAKGPMESTTRPMADMTRAGVQRATWYWDTLGETNRQVIEYMKSLTVMMWHANPMSVTTPMIRESGTRAVRSGRVERTTAAT